MPDPLENPPPRAGAVFHVIVALSLVACARPPSKARPASLPEAKVTTLEGAPLAIACTPTGPELCFNATDDNCNGVIDEGCGLGTGVLQFTAAWGDSPADVDLSVSEPSGARVSESNRASPSGMRFDRDCPGETCNGQNIENIFYEGSDPARGRYLVEVHVNDFRGGTTPLVVQFGARVGSRSFSTELRLSPSEDKKVFVFQL